ncbi:MAG TPA: sugar phosphate nucleotidyltransferase [Terracidiphilus sp.]|nr:sugar phosphate nucleotidyltransferase [Terracidiphilus sp.]
MMTPISSPTLLVLAAGMGSRYGGLKQIDPVGPAGETIIDYSIFDALRAGFGKLVFVIRKDIEQQFREIVGARFEKRVAVEYVFQGLEDIPPRFTVPAGRTKPWGTTQAILLAADAIHEPFAAINADDFYGADGYRALAGHLTSGSQDYSMVGFVLRNTLSDFGSVARGVCQVSPDGYLEHIVEMTKIERDGNGARNTDVSGTVTKLSGDEPVSMNMWGFTPQVFDQLREDFEKFLEGNATDLKSECYIPNTVGGLVRSGKARVKVLRSRDSWFGVTYREDRPRVVESIRRLIADGSYPDSLWS